jgi:hypothetical protein
MNLKAYGMCVFLSSVNQQAVTVQYVKFKTKRKVRRSKGKITKVFFRMFTTKYASPYCPPASLHNIVYREKCT